MSDGDRPSTGGSGPSRGPLTEWLYLTGDRLVIAGVVAVGLFLVTRALVALGVLAVGPRSNVPSLFSGGLVGGVLTLITVTLTINQLIATRVFGSPDSLRQRFEEGSEMADELAALTDLAASPASMVEFLSTIGSELRRRGESLGERSESHGDRGESLRSSGESSRSREPSESGGANGDVAVFASAIAAFGGRVEAVSDEMDPIDVVSTVAGSEYVRHRREATAMRASADDLSDAAREDVDAIAELLGHLSVGRQYYKTLALQQELAKLSRQIIYVSLPAVLAVVFVSLIYGSGPWVTIPAGYLPTVVSAAVAVMLLPLVVLIAHLIRVTTVMRYTVSVAPFEPPAEWPRME